PLLVSFSINKSFAGADVAAVEVGTGRYPPITMDIISWTEDDNAPNPCYNSAECWIGPDVLYSDGNPSLSGSCFDFNNCIEISSYRYAREVMEEYRKVFGIPYSATYIIDSDDYTCVGLFYTEGRPTAGVRVAKIWPNSTCGRIPPINLQCDFSLPHEIDHGILRARELDGNTITDYGTASCNNNASFKLYVTSASGGGRNIKLTPSGSLFSIITVNDKDAWNGLNVNLSANSPLTFKFASTLRTNGDVDAGSYSGDAIFTLSYQ
ncbi:hypothetical protein ACRU1U_20085, partial [Providencia stuartii]|uniref:MrpH family fimbial adhesin n=1 Tax=Providencia stuartii TaxID=588 RepID=UPI003D7F4EB6